MSEKFWIASGCCVGFIVCSFFLAGGHHELKHQWWLWKRSRNRGGYIT